MNELRLPTPSFIDEETAATRTALTSRAASWLCIAALALVVVVLHAKAVPYNNEYIYLLRLKSGFLANDWSFAQSANEHRLFNASGSLFARLLDLEVIAWLGRAIFWLLCLIPLIRLGRHWKLPAWMIAVSISVWLAVGQTIVNGEWIFGTFEAKVVAYACLLFSLDGFCCRKVVVPSVLLGLSFSFHPAVGLWAIVAVVGTLAFLRVGWRELKETILIAGVCCLPGALPLVGQTFEASGSTAAGWQFVVTVLMPFHFDPFYFPAAATITLGAMLAFNLWCLWKTESFALRFLLGFQIFTALFYAGGFLVRYLELYSLLRFMPMRLFPIMTPLFFLFTAGYALRQSRTTVRRLLVAGFALAAIAMLDPIDKGIGQMRETLDSWRSADDDGAIALKWISQNTPPESVVITSPNDRRVWYLAERAQIASYQYPRYDRLTEWRERIADLTANVPLTDRSTAPMMIEQSFSGLTADQIAALADKYHAHYVVTPALYDLPVVFKTGSVSVYRIGTK